MDFLLLLPLGVRVVIEVDGKHHYADGGGRANPSLYAAMVAADRDLRLAGYEVYRFGAAELADDIISQAVLKTFFLALFKRYGVSMARPRTIGTTASSMT
jgi:very-short-patch-repair endonuclease